MTVALVDLKPVSPWRPGHKHYVLTDGYDAILVAAYYKQCVLDMEGVIYKLTWRECETSEGVYDFTNLKRSLDFAQTEGKGFIIRLLYKSYIDTEPKRIPDYILNDHATYGGDAGSGGMILNQFDGYTPRMQNQALMARFKAFIAACGKAVGNHPALEGVSLDESTWSLSYDSGTWPVPGLKAQDLIDAFAALNQQWRDSFPGKDVYVFINFFEDSSPAKTRSVLLDYVAKGYLPAVTDTKRRPENNNTLQDVAPLYPFPEDVRSMICVDYMSTGENDSGLTERMVANAMETARVGSWITGWYMRGGSDSAWWAAIKAAIAATRV